MGEQDSGQLEGVDAAVALQHAVSGQEGDIKSDVVAHDGVPAHKIRQLARYLSGARSLGQLRRGYAGEVLHLGWNGPIGIGQRGKGALLALVAEAHCSDFYYRVPLRV